ncbi:MAG: glycosyltransferase family 39 protein [Elusimicrobia bacterium]|nr:glycosyltransferase family 39 protein [Elusimicrobiota bacterium]
MPAAIGLGVAAATLLAFWPMLGHGFLELDDPAHILANPWVRSGLTWRGLRWALTAADSDLWQPLTWLSNMADCQLYGVEPWGHHLTSLLLHGASAALLFAFLYLATGAAWKAALASCLFALHPMRVESVAWAAERKDVLSVFFWLLTCLAYWRYVQRPSRRSYGAALLYYALALMSKPMVVTLPLVLLLLDYWPLGRLSRSTAGARALEKLPFACLAAAVSLLTLRVMSVQMASSAQYPWPLRFASAPTFYLDYLANTFWPRLLSLYYYHPGAALSPWKAAASVVALAAATLLAWRGRRAHPYALTGWLWFLVALVPVIGLVQMSQRAIANRFSYIPHVGLAVALVWGADALLRGWRTPPKALLGALAVLGLAGLTRRELGYWKDPRALYERTLAVAPANELVRNILAVHLTRRGLRDEAARQFEETLRVAPWYADAHNNFGLFLAQEGQRARAESHFREALRLNPRHAQAGAHLAALLKLP